MKMNKAEEPTDDEIERTADMIRLTFLVAGVSVPLGLAAMQYLLILAEGEDSPWKSM